MGEYMSKTRRPEAARPSLGFAPGSLGNIQREVSPPMASWDSFRFIDLFAGIGGMRLAFDRLGGSCVFTSEWDAACQATYEANFGERPFGDITLVSPSQIPDHDVLLAGFPCQPFSIIGDRKGFGDTRGTLFFNIEEILRVKQPYSFLLENVKQLHTHDKGRTFATILQRLLALGYFVHVAVLNALDFGVPQRRERTLLVGFKEDLTFSFPQPLGERAHLSEVLEPDSVVDPSLFASERIRKRRLEALEVEPFFPSIWHENKSGHISVLPHSVALRANASYNYVLVNGIRRPSARELLRLQGFPDSFKAVGTYGQIRKQAGNAVPVPMIAAVAHEMLQAVRRRELLDPAYRAFQSELAL